jgi:hypothetical protein
LRFADQDGTLKKATAEDLLKMAGVTPPSSPERVANISGTVNPYQRRDLSLELVQRYLPSNYSAMEYVAPDGEEMIQIRGRDDAGWTMDEYVIPRLASADIYAREVK